jgi:hypothetical protein
MNETSNPNDPDFDLRTAKPDPRRIAYRLERTDDYHADLAYIRDTVVPMIRAELLAKYQDKTTPMFSVVIEFDEARAVMVGYGFSHSVLPAPESGEERGV